MNNIWTEWLNAARDDLLAVEELLDNELLTHIVAFHSQQAIEKSLKAVMEFNMVDVPRIHSLNRLFKMVESDITADSFEIITMLDSLYVGSRYPGDMGLLPEGKPTIAEAGNFYEFARSVYLQVERKLT